MRSLSRAFLVLCAVGVAALTSALRAQTTGIGSNIPPTGQSALTVPKENPLSSGLIIGNGDLLVVSVYGAPDFGKEVRVADSGEISLPLIGSVHVAGVTVEQAEELVQTRLDQGGYFTNPQVSIFEKEYATQGISVLGEVQKPGSYPLVGNHVLFDAISAAGGLTAKAGNTITITRRSNSQSHTVVLPPNESFNPSNNVPVFPGDTIAVSKAGIVYVVGDVHMPSGFVMENSRMTILQAIAMAQGTNTTAKVDKAVLIRKDNNGPQQISIPLRKILAAKAPDMQLQAEDIIFVPRSEGKAAMHRTLDAVLQAATGAAIYRPY